MEYPTNLDPRIYGGEAPLPAPSVIEPSEAGAVAAATPAPARVSTDLIGADSTSIQEGQAAIREANRPKATYGESATAAAKSWGITRLVDWYNTPDFDKVEGYNVAPSIRNAPIGALAESEHKYLAGSVSQEDFNHRLEVTQRHRKYGREMADNKALSFIVSALDPLDLMIDVASAGIASGATRGMALARAGQRLTAGATAAGLTVGAGALQQQAGPVDNGDILLGALVNGAAAATFINPVTRRFDKVDPEFPDVALRQSTKNPNAPDPVEAGIASEAADAVEFARTRPATPQPAAAPVVPEVAVATPVVDTAGKAVARPVDAPVEAAQAVAPAAPVEAVVSLPATLSKASPNYAIGQKQFKVAFDSDLDRAAYIVSGKGKSKSHDAYVKWAESTGQDLGALRARGDAIRAELKAQAATTEGKELRIGKAAATSDAPVAPSLMIPGDVTPAQLARKGATNLSEPFDAYTALARHEADPDFGPMIRTLRKEHGEALSQVRTREGDVANPFYAHDDATVYLSRKATAFEALHESIHGLTVNKIAYGKAHPDTAHGRLVQELETLRAEVDAKIAKLHPAMRSDMARNPKAPDASYYTQNLEEFVAGLFAGKSDGFTRVMASMPVTGSRSALTKMVGVVRKLLGIKPREEVALTKALGLTDELMRIKLDVSNEAGDFVASFAPSGTPTQIGGQVAGWWAKQAGSTGSEKTARKLEWSLSGKLRKQGTEGERVSRLLVDDPIEMTGDSAVSQRTAIRGELMQTQMQFEDALRAAMKEQGAGVVQMVTNSRKAIGVQQSIERQVHEELARRENAVRRGQPVKSPNVDPKISNLADLYDRATAQGLAEMKTAQVRGADTIQTGAGYATRKWDVAKLEAAEAEFLATGATEAQARKGVRDLISAAIQKANPVPKDMADDMAQAITERTRRKGYFEDMPATGAMGDDGAQAVRALLAGSGISPQRMRQVEEFLTGRKDDEGLMSSLKHRIPMDMTASINVNGRDISMLDLVDNSVTRNLDSYLDDAAGQAGLARKGLADNSDIVKLRGEFLKGIASEANRKEAAALFDNTIKAIKGQPVGEEMNKAMRQLSAVTTSVGLANSGWWQVMEYANIAAKYGMVKTVKEVLARMPGARALVDQVAHNVDEAGSMAHVLTNNSSADLRIRPFLAKMDDNFVIPTDERVTLALQQAKQLVPYINVMKYVHGSQANITANLITDTFARGAKGDVKAREALARYGLEGHQLDALRSEIAQHGLKVDDWSQGAWDSVRGPLNKMMDDAVLKNRTGELPAFAQFSTLGKFIFTYRSFVLGAHNKVLSGTLGRHGFTGLGALMAYQFPLAMMSTYAVGAVKGKAEDDPQKVAAQALGQMSALGLFTEMWGVATGEKKQFGAPGLMAIDRVYKTGSQAAQGNMGAAGASLLSSVPLLAIMPGIKALSEQLKD